MKNKDGQLDLIGNYIVIVYALFLVRTIGAWSLLPSKIDSVLFGAAGLIGGLLLAWDFLGILMKKRKFDYDFLLVAFLISFSISIVLNINLSPLGNIKVLAWQAVFLLLFFSAIKTRRISEKFFDVFQGILISFGFLMSFASLLMFFTRFNYRIVLTQKTNPLRIGFVENRLFGAYTDPNYASVMAVIVIVFSLYYLMQRKLHWGMKTFLIFNVFVQISYIALSGSRNGLITLLFACGVGGFFYAYHLFGDQVIKKIGIGLVIGGLLGSLGFLAVSGCKWLYPQLPAIAVVQENNANDSQDEIHGSGEDDIDLTREDIASNGDVSNLRFTLWKSALEIFKQEPLFGVPSKSLHQYAINHLPNTYLAKTKLAVHNAYVYLLVSTGIVGTLIMAVFILKMVVEALIYAFKSPLMIGNFLPYLISCGVLAVSGMFHNELFLMATSSAIVFWVFLGKLKQETLQSEGAKK